MTLFLDFEEHMRFSQAKTKNKCVWVSVRVRAWMCVFNTAAQYGRKRRALLTQEIRDPWWVAGIDGDIQCTTRQSWKFIYIYIYISLSIPMSRAVLTQKLPTLKAYMVLTPSRCGQLPSSDCPTGVRDPFSPILVTAPFAASHGCTLLHSVK